MCKIFLLHVIAPELVGTVIEKDECVSIDTSCNFNEETVAFRHLCNATVHVV